MYKRKPKIVDNPSSKKLLSNVGFFAKASNLTAWDSIPSHSSGLKKVAEIFNAPRKKTTQEELTLSYRHGIMHGRDLGFWQ